MQQKLIWTGWRILPTLDTTQISVQFGKFERNRRPTPSINSPMSHRTRGERLSWRRGPDFNVMPRLGFDGSIGEDRPMELKVVNVDAGYPVFGFDSI